MNIAIIGGGNNGSTLAVKFSQNHKVTLYVSNRNNEINKYSKNLKLFSDKSKTPIVANIDKITDSIEEALADAEIVFITYPQFLYNQLAIKMFPYIKENTHLIFVPGSGGAELYFKDFLSKKCTLTGLQRVHAVTRIIEKGQSVREMGVRDSLRIASIPNSANAKLNPIIENLFALPVKNLPNYLNITLVNSNPILHTSRLYSIFKDYYDGKLYDKIPLFYEEWDIESSQLLIKMDTELQNVLSVFCTLGIDATEILPILTHYESVDAQTLTNKIQSIQSFKGLQTPTIMINGKFIPDFSSRYFSSDFPYGLDILLSFAEMVKVNHDNMLSVSN